MEKSFGCVSSPLITKASLCLFRLLQSVFGRQKTWKYMQCVDAKFFD